MGGVGFVLWLMNSSVLLLDSWNFPPSERTTNDWNLRSLGPSNHLLFKASVPCVHLYTMYRVSWIPQKLPRCSKYLISNRNSQPDLRGEIDTQNKNKGKINNCGFDPMKTASLLLTKTCLSKSEGYSKTRVATQLSLRMQDMPPPAVFLACFQKAALKKLEFPGNLKPSFLTFFQPGSNRPKWRMWTTCGSWAPKIRRIKWIKESSVATVALGKQVLPQSGADQRCQAQWHWQGEGEIRGEPVLMTQVRHDDTWHMHMSCLHIFFFMVIWNLT